MTSYLIEAYTPASESISAIEERARHAAVELKGAGIPVTYDRSIFVPEDELCLHPLHGPSRDGVLEAARRAGIAPVRVVETAPRAGDQQGGTP